MIYPQKLNAKNTNFIMKTSVITSVIVAIFLFTLNKIFTPNSHWATLCNAGIAYIWIVFLYSIKRNNNIADVVLMQLIVLSVLTVFIDIKTNFEGWSVNIAIPILIIIANITMLILTIANRKQYIQYAICQLLIILFSMLPLLFIYKKISNNKTLCFIASGISMFNFIISLILSSKDIKEALIRKFHF